MENFLYLIFIFFVYSVIGWIAEVIIAAFRYGKLTKRGFINGPMCPKYGFAMVLITIDVYDLKAHPLFQLIVCIMAMAVFEYVSGIILHKLTGYRFWDYSNIKGNMRGYICVRSVLLLGMAGAAFAWFLNPFLRIIYLLVPQVMVKAVLIVLIVLFLIDVFVTIAASLNWRIEGNIYENVATRLNETKVSMGKRLFNWIQRRMYKAFPEFKTQVKTAADGFGKPEDRVFAKGICVEKLIWIFLISALVGDIIETIFVRVTADVWMSRSSVLYGPFSIVWGLGGAFATALLYPLKDKNDRFVFLGGMLLGGVYEYTCSVFTELVFGTVFWDYSHLPFNINGRVNLLYCFFWGIAAIFWVKVLYPAASRIIEKIPPVAGKVITVLAVVAMTANMIISGCAIGRYVGRSEGAAPDNTIERIIDETYVDSFIERVYPNMKITH